MYYSNFPLHVLDLLQSSLAGAYIHNRILMEPICFSYFVFISMNLHSARFNNTTYIIVGMTWKYI